MIKNNWFKKLKAFFGGTAEEQEEALENKFLSKYDCWWCEKPIPENEHYTFNGKRFHIQCKRNMIKQAKKDLGY